MKKVQPTFGISFGLPQQGLAGYPISPYGPNPLVNPYGGALGQQGINLGLVSVNPLVSLQVTKDDYGAKIVKPFVNLHVTPNNYLLHKVGDLLNYKKHVVFNKHKHYHLHKPPHYHHGPHHLHHGPEFHPIGPHGYHESPHAYHEGPHSYPSGPHGYPEGPSEYPNPEYPSSPHLDHDPNVGYYDNPHNYGGGHYPELGPSFYGRSQNATDLVQGNDILDQYSKLQDQTYGQSLSSRIGKILTSNQIKFPIDRKKRDLYAQSKPEQVCTNTPHPIASNVNFNFSANPTLVPTILGCADRAMFAAGGP